MQRYLLCLSRIAAKLLSEGRGPVGAGGLARGRGRGLGLGRGRGRGVGRGRGAGAGALLLRRVLPAFLARRRRRRRRRLAEPSVWLLASSTSIKDSERINEGSTISLIGSPTSSSTSPCAYFGLVGVAVLVEAVTSSTSVAEVTAEVTAAIAMRKIKAPPGSGGR